MTTPLTAEIVVDASPDEEIDSTTIRWENDDEFQPLIALIVRRAGNEISADVSVQDVEALIDSLRSAVVHAKATRDQLIARSDRVRRARYDAFVCAER